jgi:predicted RNA-binding protein YlqC (UPF0109 family)
MITLLDYIVKKVIDKPSEAIIEFSKKNGHYVAQVRVAPSDLPRIIGSEGRLFRSIRGLVSLACQKKYNEACDLVIDTQ